MIARTCTTLALALAACAGPRAASPPAPPNVVLILADDLGYGDVHALWPESRLPTPNLDRLAAAGMTFTDAHSPAAVCTPTRYALLTGRYCWRTRLTRGVLGGYSAPLLEEGRRTIADVLRERGYRTAGVGKWHLGMALPLRAADADLRPWSGDPGIDFAGRITDGPLQHGFDEYFGVTASLDMAPYVWVRDDGFTMEPSLTQPAVPFPHFVRAGPRAEDFVMDEVLDRLVEEAVGFVDRAASSERPFFLYLPLTAPHKPAQPHERFRGTTGLGEYGDFVAQVDDAVGRVLAALDGSAVAEDTLVVFTSDNGSYMYRYDDGRADHVDDAKVQGFRAERHRSNGPFRGTKADVWEAGHHVPLLVRWHGRVPPGSMSDETVCLTDLFPTLAEVAGAPLGPDVAEDGVSLLPALAGERFARGAPVVHHSVSGMFAIREGRWKLVLGNGSGGRERPIGKPFEGPYALFDLVADPGETMDLAESHPAVVERLTRALEGVRARGRSVERSAAVEAR